MAEGKNGSLELMQRCITDAIKLTGQFREYSPEAIAILAAELYRDRAQMIIAKFPVGLDHETLDELLEVLEDIQHGGVAIIPDCIELKSGKLVEIEVKMRDEKEVK